MSKRVVAATGVIAFAVVVATVAVLASRGGPAKLQKLPLGSAGASSARDGAASSAMLSPVRPVEYRVAGTLPPLEGPATAYRLSGSVDASTVAKLARAFGLDGAVKEDPDGWVVHDASHEVRVTKDASLPWSYGPYYSCGPDAAVSSSPSSGPATDPAGPNAVKPPDGGTVSSSGCVVSGGVVSSGGGVSSGGSAGSSAGSTGPGTVAPAPPASGSPQPVALPPETTIPQRPAELGTQDEARDRATSLLRRAGIDLTNADVHVEDAFTSWQVLVDPSVGGRSVVGLSTSVTVGPKAQVAYASGFLAGATAIGDYPLVGTTKGVERLRTGFGVGPRPMMGASEGAAGVPAGGPGSATSDSAPTRPSPAPPITTLPPQVRIITGVHLGLTYIADYSSAGRGKGYLVPAYVFTINDGTTASIVAVTDDLLATTVGTDVVPDGKR